MRVAPVQRRQRGIAADQLLHLALRLGAVEGGPLGLRSQGQPDGNGDEG